MNVQRRLFTGNLTTLALVGLAGKHGASHAQPVPDNEAGAPGLPATGVVLRLPDVTLFDGSLFSQQQADGHVTLIYWWASWCPFCAEQNPFMQQLWLQKKDAGLQMLALSIDRKRDDATNYLRRRGYTFPAGLVTPAIAKVLPKPKGLPVTIVRGRDGRVLQAEKGQLFPEDVQQLARWL
jgi:thiol-disulfide isomerase/thioredoxin